MMKRLVALLFFGGLLALALLLVAPGFIDWNQHKSAVIARIQPYFQRPVDVSGGMSLRVLPQPEIMLEGVSLDGGKLMTIRQLGLRIRLAPLLNGRVEVESLDLIGPVLNLEKGNWQDVLNPAVASALDSAAGGVQLGRATVADGEINVGGTKFTRLNLAVSADTLFGPYHASGDMAWRGTAVKIGLETDKYDGATPVPLRLDIIPSETLPHLRFDGVLDAHAGLDAQGELSISQGTLASLMGYDALSFLRETVDLKGVLEVKDGQFALTDIKAKVGTKGELHGKMSVQFPANARATAKLDLDGSNLVLTDAKADPYLAAPGNFTVTIAFKGRNVVWDGYKLATVTLAADVAPQAWTMRALQATLADGSQVSASGAMTPGADSGSYTIGLSTPDAGKLAALLQPGDNSIFKALADSGVVHKLVLSSRLDVSPARVSLFSLDATAEDKMNVSGVINIDRTAPRANVTAKLDFTDWDMSAAPGFDAFVKAVRAGDSDLELTARNLSLKNLHVANLAFSAKMGADGLEIRQASGALSEHESFSLNGKLTAAGADIAYKLKAAQPANVASALGLALPPPVRWKDADIAGTIRSSAAGSDFTIDGTADGGGVKMNGNVSPTGDYRANVRLTQKSVDAGWAQLGLPVSALFSDEGDFDFAGELNGRADDYTIGKIVTQAGKASVTGTLMRKAGQTGAELQAGSINLDRWLGDDWRVKQAFLLTLRGDELIYMGRHVVNPQLTLGADATMVKIPDLKGALWGGPMTAALTLSRQGNGWAAAIKGRVEKADLAEVTGALGLRGLSTAGATLDADLASPDNTPGSLSGDISAQAASAVVSGFNMDKVAEVVNALKAVPPALDQMVAALFHENGATTFRNLQAEVHVQRGHVKAEGIQIDHPAGFLAMRGEAGGGTTLDGTLMLKNMPKLGPLHVTRAAGADYVVDTAPFLKYVTARNPGPVPVAPDVTAVPDAVPAQETPAPAGSAVDGILNRLDKE